IRPTCGQMGDTLEGRGSEALPGGPETGPRDRPAGLAPFLPIALPVWTNRAIV
ncbi:hypothetical protein P7K49_031306, partial [Saguinus oedipus]